jgi:hypothetical protein
MDDPRTHFCVCGGIGFVSSVPQPDEEQLALKLYGRELEEGGAYTKIAREILDDWRAEHPLDGDTPERKRIYLK